MEIQIESVLPIYEKCGEILTACVSDKRLYALKCEFCEQQFSIFFDFVDHIEETHILSLKNEQKDASESEEPIHAVTAGTCKNSSISTDPLTNVELIATNENCDEKDLSKSTKNLQANDDTCSNFDYECASSEEYSENIESAEDSEPGNSSLDAELDANQEVTLALIEGFRKLPVLWHKSRPQQKTRKKREEALQNLAKQLNNRFGKRIKWTGIDERLKKLHKCYSGELIKEKAAKSNGGAFEPSWYFPKLDFLRSTIKVKTKNSENITGKPRKNVGIPFNEEQHLQFIKMYESFPCLWNTEDIFFNSKTQRENAIKQTMRLVEETLKVKLSESDVLRRIKCLKAACTKEKQELINAEQKGIAHQPTLKYFSSITFLLDHIYPFKCPFCSETFKGFNMLRVHKSQHDGSSPFTCSICKKVLSSSVNLSIHLRRHNRDFTFECQPCSKKFATPEEYRIHKRQHSGEKPYFCDVCGKSFATCSLFGRHKRRHENRPTHTCTICNRGFYEQIRYKEHMNIHNNVRDRICDVCGKGFTHLKHLKTHKLIHSGRRDYVCKICGKDFAQSAGLYCHMKTHGNKIGDKTDKEEKIKKIEIAKDKISSNKI